MPTKMLFTVPTWTPTAVADAADFTAGGFMAIQGGASGQLTKITSIFAGGVAGATAAGTLLLARDSTVGVSPTTLVRPNANGPANPSSGALSSAPKAFVTSTTKPQRSNSVAYGSLALPFNAFGGVARWVAGPGEEFWIVGNTADTGEVSLTQYTGSGLGAIGTTVSYETL